MKSNKGITITSLVIYVIAMSIVVATIATLTSYFYSNMDELDSDTNSSIAYTELNTYLSKEINTKENYPILLEETSSEYIIFIKTGNQYTFKNGAIYQNQVKICSNIAACTFEVGKTDENTGIVDTVKIYLKTTGDLEYTNTYKIQSF